MSALDTSSHMPHEVPRYSQTETCHDHGITLLLSSFVGTPDGDAQPRGVRYPACQQTWTEYEKPNGGRTVPFALLPFCGLFELSFAHVSLCYLF